MIFVTGLEAERRMPVRGCKTFRVTMTDAYDQGGSRKTGNSNRKVVQRGTGAARSLFEQLPKRSHLNLPGHCPTIASAHVPERLRAATATVTAVF